MSLKFESEDFFHIGPSGDCPTSMEMAFVAQKKFDTWLKENSQVVYAKYKSKDGCIEILAPDWHPLEGKPGNTHKALLINIEEIQKCTHPKEKVTIKTLTPMSTGYVDNIDVLVCECGARVQPSGFEEIK